MKNKKTIPEKNVPVKVPTTKIIIVTKKLRYTPCKLQATGKHWYVYFYFQIPGTNRMHKIMHKKGLNRIKNLKERKKYGNELVAAFNELLAQGYNPFSDAGLPFDKVSDFSTKYNLVEAFEYALKHLETDYEPTTYRDFKSRVNQFCSWAKINGIDDIPVGDFNRRHASAFLNSKAKSVSGKTVNNFRAMLSMVLSKLTDDDIVEDNFIPRIKKRNEKPERNKAFTSDQIEAIKTHLLKHDPHLYLYMKLITYTFLRNREVLRLQVKDVDLKNRVISIKTKTETLSYAFITDQLLPVFEPMELDKKSKDLFIIGQTDILQHWESDLSSKVRYFGKRFAKVRKELKLYPDQTIYSLRHTFALDLFNSFVKEGNTEKEAILKMLPITRHKNESGLRNYLRNIGGFVAKDYSSRYSVSF